MIANLDQFECPVEILFNLNTINDKIFKYFNKGLFVTTSGMIRRGAASDLKKNLPNMDWIDFEINPNPTLSSMLSASKKLHGISFDFIVALGGGSVIDSAKMFSCLLADGGTHNLEEWISQGGYVQVKKPIYLLAVPSTAGTGSEVTSFSTIWDRENLRKLSFFGESLYPKTALLNPKYSQNLPRQITLYTTLDAISHCLESLWNLKATERSMERASNALSIIMSNLPNLDQNPEDINTRRLMLKASNLAGLAINENKTALAHSISYPITINFDVPHGLAASFTLPTIYKLFIKNNNAISIHSKYANLVSDACDLINKLDLKKEIYRFCTLEQILEISHEMIDGKRSLNFPALINTNDVNEILRESLK